MICFLMCLFFQIKVKEPFISDWDGKNSHRSVPLVLFPFEENINNSTRIWISSVQLSSGFYSLSFNLWWLYAHDTIPQTSNEFCIGSYCLWCPFLPFEYLGVLWVYYLRESSPEFSGDTKEAAASHSDLNTSYYRANPELPLKLI